MTRDETRQLGELMALVRVIGERMEEDRQARQEAEAEDQRHRADLARRVSDTEASVEALHGRLGRVEPVTEMVTGVRAKLIGAGIVLSLIGTVVMAALAAFKDKIFALLGW